MRKTIVFSKRPWLHHFIIVGYVVAPFANILLMRLFLRIPLPVIVSRLLEGYGVLAVAWLVTAPLVGVCLYFVTQFSWYLFLAHSGLILLDFVIKWISRPQYYLSSISGLQNILIAGGNVALVAFVAYIITRDFRAPYFQVLPRGWRARRRVAISHQVTIEGRPRMISDLSTSGCFIADCGAGLGAGSRVRLSFPGDSTSIDCVGVIVRTTAGGYGIRFVGLQRRQKRDIARLLRKPTDLPRRGELPRPLVLENRNPRA